MPTCSFVPPARADLDSLVIQPDPALMADGLVQITALAELSMGDVFRFAVEYVRSGPLVAGQRYEVLDSGFEFIGDGQVLDAAPGAPLPEPGGLALAGAALAAMFALPLRRRSFGPRARPGSPESSASSFSSSTALGPPAAPCSRGPVVPLVDPRLKVTSSARRKR